ncbi:hypothetical protein GCM10025866_12440 [Naasia aerilata]|uniref:Uncharacterized protein n=1 Tax=Naasia aerilata TaxID=1162966 RepID=A0ABM8GAU4_9MICO|nr:hypothetical protein GCM10025866_12440 [Naasia aerilata]
MTDAAMSVVTSHASPAPIEVRKKPTCAPKVGLNENGIPVTLRKVSSPVAADATVQTAAAPAARSRARPVSRSPPSASATRASAPTVTETARSTTSFAAGRPKRTTGPGSSISRAAAAPPMARAARSARKAATRRVPVPIRRGAGAAGEGTRSA